MFLADTFNNTGLIIFGVVVLVVIILSIVISTINKKQNALVDANSPYLKEIRQINSQYNFFKFRSSLEDKNFYLKSKRQFDNFNYRKVVVIYIRENQRHFASVVEAINTNKQLLVSYNK